jgi:predicted metal-binding membrane protein
MSTRTDASSPATRFAVPAALLLLAAAGWTWSARMASDMTMDGMGSMHGMGSMEGMDMSGTAMSFAAFLFAWFAMMAAMMFPAISPVVKLYSRGAAAGRVAPLPFFVSGYIVLWTVLGVPAYFAWRALMGPIADVRPWAAYLAGGVLVAAALWQLTPLKSACLRHCRSPMSAFLQSGASATRPFGAAKMGAIHGLYCIGCCWALMAVLVAMGTMNLAWMLGLSVLILLEKNARAGERIALVGAAALGMLGLLLLVRPETLSVLT